jgi:plastocyanin
MTPRHRLNGIALGGLAIALLLVACNPLGGIQKSIQEASTAVSAAGTASVGFQTATSDLATSAAPALSTAQPLVGSAVPAIGTAIANPTIVSGLATAGAGGVVAIIDQGGKVAFIPETVTIAVGGTVRWTNTTPRPVNIVGDNDSFSTGDIALLGVGQAKFDKAGTFNYSSKAQPDSKGKVVVQ